MASHEGKTAVDYDASAPILSIVIVNYKTKGLLKYCLRGLLKSNFPFPTEVIVVDNASNDGSVPMVQTLFPSIRLFALSRNGGFAAGNNEGIRHAQGKYILIMNPDIVAQNDAIVRLCTFLDRYPKVAAVGPRLVHPDGTLQYSCFRFPTLAIPFYRRTPLGRFAFARKAVASYCMADMDRRRACRVDWLLGACILVRRDVIDHVGLMDERFFLYFEDVDWCRRFGEAGLQVWYEPEAVLTHFHQRLSAEATGLGTLFSRVTRIHIVSGIKYFLKHGI